MAMVPRLIAEEGVLAGTQITLQDNQSWVIGSDTNSCEIILQEDGIGAQQAEITLDIENGSYAIRNLNLATPLLVNDVSITEEEYALEEGDVIVLGGSVLRFFSNEEDLVFFDAEDGTSSQGGGAGKSDNPSQQDSDETFNNESDASAPTIEEVEASNSSAPLNNEKEVITDEQQEEIPPVQSSPPSSSKLTKKETPIEESEAIPATEIEEISEVEMIEPTKIGKSKKNKKSILPDEQEEPVINPNEEPSDKVASEGASASDIPSTEAPIAQAQEIKATPEEAKKELSAPPSALPQEEAPAPPSALPQEEVIKPTLPEEQHLPAENSGEQFKIQDLFAFDDGIFEDKEKEDSFVDLARTSRFLLKVIAGPNVGAEFGVDPEHTYTIGTDTTICDIIFNDLSVSHKHAQLKVNGTGQIMLEDLQSRNGVLLDGQRIKEAVIFPEGAFASLGTTVFSIIDREHPAETLVAGSFFRTDASHRRTENTSSLDEGSNSSDLPFMDEAKKGNTFSSGILIMALLIGGLAVLFGIGTASLFGEKEIRKERIDFHHEIHNVVKYFPAVNFSYNKVTGELFLSGHVRTGLERNELLHNLASFH